jgi:hypothetical protein
MEMEGKNNHWTTVPDNIFRKIGEVKISRDYRKILIETCIYVFENKKESQGKWELRCEGHAPKKSIAKKAGTSVRTVMRAFNAFKERKIFLSADLGSKLGQPKKVYRSGDKIYERDTTWVKINMDTDQWVS